MKRLKLQSYNVDNKKQFCVDCGGYDCSYNCPLFKIVCGWPILELSKVENKSAIYGECAVTLVWAKFYKLY